MDDEILGELDNSGFHVEEPDLGDDGILPKKPLLDVDEEEEVDEEEAVGDDDADE